MAFWHTKRPAGRIPLESGATVAVIGGGPSGAFFVLHLLQEARAAGRQLNVVVFERSRKGCGAGNGGCPGGWHGCNYCAGGISPRLYDVLQDLSIPVPDRVVQGRVERLTIHGFWKNIELETPPGRQLLTVFRGSRPAADAHMGQSFDAFLLEQARTAGARVIPEEVSGVAMSPAGKPVITYGAPQPATLEADFVVFATGVNERPGLAEAQGRMWEAARRLLPRYEPPRTRRTLIFELEVLPVLPNSLRRSLVFVEYGSRELPIEMSSLVPKQRCVTVVLIGRCVDRIRTTAEGWAVMQAFLKLPHVRRFFSPATELKAVCFCSPAMVVSPARHPFADRVTAVGDFVTTRLYKDGILSAQQTAHALARTVLADGIDEDSLARGYGPTLSGFARNNRFAGWVFLLHRMLFSSSILSRVLYQAVISERKTRPAVQRRLEHILWRIASGDEEYERIFWSMLHPATLAAVATGAIVTLRNYLTELAFGLNWSGFGRFTTGVALERLEEKRRQFASLVVDAGITLPSPLDFESMYTIRIGAPRPMILEELENFGEADRAYLKPRGIRIRRVAGQPHEAGCVIRYQVFLPHFSFHLELEKLFGDHFAVYRVKDGFARGGVLLFEVESLAAEDCLLSIYVAFNFPEGRGLLRRLFWRAFRRLFPAYLHDVLWNHSLCQMKENVERAHQTRVSRPAYDVTWNVARVDSPLAAAPISPG